MSVTVNGDYFLQNSELSLTIGNKVGLEFLSPDQLLNKENGELPFDFKKTGDYLITKAAHIISRENYYLNLEVSKVSDRVQQ
jgi:hypothetical protein